jgi:hypothetical protein
LVGCRGTKHSIACSVKPANEFKFACPVCHQHMLADVASAGEHVECPTCHKQIIVPKVPGGATTKLILRGTQVSSTRGSTRFKGAGPQVVARTAVSIPMQPSLVMVAVVSFLVVAALILALSRGAHF